MYLAVGTWGTTWPQALGRSLGEECLRHNSAMGRFAVIPLILITLAVCGLSQRLDFEGHDESPRPGFPANGEFHFVRLEYNDLPQFHRRWGYSSRSGTGEGWWIVDWPDAEDHFSSGVQRLTRIATAEPLHMRLADDRLFDNPWIYATQAGWWNLSDAETARLREYLLRGGFLVVDDFWGDEPWKIFRDTMDRVLPRHQILDIEMDASVMHVVYDIEKKDLSFIPGTRHLRAGPDGSVVVHQPEGTAPAWRSLNDNHGRMVVAVNFNTDVGDAWEYADSPRYPEHMTALAYRYGINYLVYAMTH